MDRNEFFREAVLRISSSLDFGVALERLLEILARIMPVEAVFATLYIREQKVIRVFDHAWLTKKFTVFHDLPLTPDMISHAEDVLASEAGILIMDGPESNPIGRGWLQVDPEVWNSSCIVVPMKIETNWNGMLVFLSKNRNEFKEGHADYIREIQEPLSLAWFNSLHYQELIQLKDSLDEENRALSQEIRHLKGDAIIGSASGLKGVMEMVAQVASLDSPVLLLGETGVGKEVIANAIHGASSRSDGPFIKVNCGAIPEGLMDSELFGHEKGAFTGALSRKRGKFERAHGGTLFLDEIGELPPAAQIRLLRVLQHREIERVGGSEMIPVDVRIISATHRNLEKRIQTGQFREDLWFRLNIFPITIPPLRYRKNDIPELVRYFLKKKSMDLKIHPAPQVQEGEVDRLGGWSWPGNVRELENIVERALIQSRSRGGRVIFDLPMGEEPGTVVSDTPFPSLDMVAVRHIRKALEHSGGQIHGAGGAAELLGINPNTLRSRMRRLGIYQKRKADG
jgi:transcriptional regulator with GAF, ATPase, and Fis domain